MDIRITPTTFSMAGYTAPCSKVVYEVFSNGSTYDGFVEVAPQEIRFAVKSLRVINVGIGANSQLELFHDRAEIDGHPVMMYGQIVTWLEWFAELMSNKV